VLAAVPVVLCAVFALPESTRRSLAFAYAEPTVLTAFTAHYVHLDVGHLAGNVAGYILLAGVGYALAVLGGTGGSSWSRSRRSSPPFPSCCRH